MYRFDMSDMLTEHTAFLLRMKGFLQTITVGCFREATKDTEKGLTSLNIVCDVCPSTADALENNFTDELLTKRDKNGMSRSRCIL